MLAGSPDGNLRLWDGESGKELRCFDAHGSWVRSLAVSRDGKRVLAGYADGTLCVWDVESGGRDALLGGHRAYLVAVALSPDGRLALSAGVDGTVRLWEVASGRELRRLLKSAPTSGVAFTADGRGVLAWGPGTPWCVLWEVSSGKKLYVPGAVPEDHVVRDGDDGDDPGRGAPGLERAGRDSPPLAGPPAPPAPPTGDDSEIVVDLEALPGSVIVRRNGQTVETVKGPT